MKMIMPTIEIDPQVEATLFKMLMDHRDIEYLKSIADNDETRAKMLFVLSKILLENELSYSDDRQLFEMMKQIAIHLLMEEFPALLSPVFHKQEAEQEQPEEAD